MALVAAARTYLRPAETPVVPKYQVHNELSGDGQINV
jgi:hypothetical protein